MSPKVSIIIPVYNIERYLGECLDSVLAQTLREIEVICVDDGSTDRSPEILDEYARKDERMIVIHQKNAGPASARNAGLEKAQGEYVLFVDSDDTVKPDICEKTVAVADRERADVTFFFYASSYMTAAQFRKLELVISSGKTFKIEDRSLQENAFFLFGFTPPWTHLTRKSYIARNAIRFVDVSGEDIVFLWQSLLLSPNVAIVPEYLYIQRDLPSSISRDLNRGYRNRIALTFSYLRDVTEKQGLFRDEWKRLYLHVKLTTQYAAYLTSPRKFRKELLSSIKGSISRDERKYLDEKNEISWHVKEFYRGLDGSKMALFNSKIMLILLRARTMLRRCLKR